jgi:hypothetical protein
MLIPAFKLKKKQKLTIELVPQSSWYKNVRSSVSTDEWDIIRKRVYKQAHYCCEICGDAGTHHPVECHEIWEYEDKKHIQKLVGLIALCPACHEVKHIGFAQLQGRYAEAISHLCKVNSISRNKAYAMVEKAGDINAKRGKKPWTLDLTFLEEFKKEEEKEREEKK